MRVLTAAALESTLDYPSLVDRLREYFRDDEVVAPLRQQYTVDNQGTGDGTLLLMPAWRHGGYIGVKIASVFPDNPADGLPSVMASYLLMSGRTGEPLALIDGRELTARRTACASALASRHLSRPDCERLLMVGTGALAPHLIRAHASQRPICNVVIWGRDERKAAKLAARLNRRDFRVAATNDLETAARGAHIICCATMAHKPLIRGAWLQPGQHVDLVGGFTPDMREADDDAIRRAQVYVDTKAGALAEGGDIIQPIRNGVLSESGIVGDLIALARGTCPGRGRYDSITLFKSVGSALEDLAGAKLAYERA